MFFRHFRDGKQDYLARTWLIDPHEAQSKTDKSPKKQGRETWNGRDFYINIGEGPHRTWEDCHKYGFVCGGGGKWYSQTLNLLFPGARVFVNIPGTGYVGVGIAKESAASVKEFAVDVDGTMTPILKAPLKAPNLVENAEDSNGYEYFVRVEWIKTVSKDDAYWEKGLFASTHTACRLRNRFTIDRLCEHFKLED